MLDWRVVLVTAAAAAVAAAGPMLSNLTDALVDRMSEFANRGNDDEETSSSEDEMIDNEDEQIDGGNGGMAVESEAQHKPPETQHKPPKAPEVPPEVPPKTPEVPPKPHEELPKAQPKPPEAQPLQSDGGKVGGPSPGQPSVGAVGASPMMNQPSGVDDSAIWVITDEDKKGAQFLEEMRAGKLQQVDTNKGQTKQTPQKRKNEEKKNPDSGKRQKNEGKKRKTPDSACKQNPSGKKPKPDDTPIVVFSEDVYRVAMQSMSSAKIVIADIIAAIFEEYGLSYFIPTISEAMWEQIQKLIGPILKNTNLPRKTWSQVHEDAIDKEFNVHRYFRVFRLVLFNLENDYDENTWMFAQALVSRAVKDENIHVERDCANYQNLVTVIYLVFRGIVEWGSEVQKWSFIPSYMIGTMIGKFIDTFIDYIEKNGNTDDSLVDMVKYYMGLLKKIFKIAKVKPHDSGSSGIESALLKVITELKIMPMPFISIMKTPEERRFLKAIGTRPSNKEEKGGHCDIFTVQKYLNGVNEADYDNDDDGNEEEEEEDGDIDGDEDSKDGRKEGGSSKTNGDKIAKAGSETEEVTEEQAQPTETGANAATETGADEPEAPVEEVEKPKALVEKVDETEAPPQPVVDDAADGAANAAAGGAEEDRPRD